MTSICKVRNAKFPDLKWCLSDTVPCFHVDYLWPIIGNPAWKIKTFFCENYIFNMLVTMHALRILVLRTKILQTHDDVIKWKHFPRYWPFLRRIHRSPVNSPHKGQWRGALMFSLIWTWINSWVNNPEAGDLRRHRAHCDVIVMNILSRRLYNSFKGDIYLLSILWYYWQYHTINNYKWNNSGLMKFD